MGAGPELAECYYWPRHWRGVAQRRCSSLGHAPASGRSAGKVSVLLWPQGQKGPVQTWGRSDDVAPGSAASLGETTLVPPA